MGNKVLHQLPVPSQQAVEQLVGGSFALRTEASGLLLPLRLHHLLHSPGHRLLAGVFLEDQREEESGEDLIDEPSLLLALYACLVLARRLLGLVEDPARQLDQALEKTGRLLELGWRLSGLRPLCSRFTGLLVLLPNAVDNR